MSVASAHRELTSPPVESGLQDRPAPTLKPALRQKLLAAVAARTARRDADYGFLKDSRHATSSALVDYLFALPGDVGSPHDVFDRLRWGGQFVFLSPHMHDVQQVAHQFHRQGGFVIDRPITSTRTGLGLPLINRRVYFFMARKVALIAPGRSTERFTFDVQLGKNPLPGAGADRREYAVHKRIPNAREILRRLKERHPELDETLLARRAMKLVQKIFPVFLTREAAFLKILRRDLPEHLRCRVPQLLHLEKNEKGLVTKIVMNWLRIGGRRLTQLEFAKQAAELLHAVHETVGVIHLDIRLDNMVITPDGVSFVDWGSAVRIGEDVTKNPMLESLFDEMMSTSQIQRLLGRMKRSGTVTSSLLCDAHQRIDPAVDLFYLAVQVSKPHGNPDLIAFIEHDEHTVEAARLKQLTDLVLRPPDPQHPTITSAKQFLQEIEKIERDLAKDM